MENRLKLNIFILGLLFLMSCSSTQQSVGLDGSEKVSYFNELVFGAEFGSSNQKIKKWAKDINIFVAGNPSKHLNSELDFLITEINGLINNIKLIRVKTVEESNYLIYFGKGENYAKFEPNATSKVEENWGLFWVYWNAENELYKGSMYVDIERVVSHRAQKHLLREELTQSLGIMNDSYRYRDSIFYQKWTQTTHYSDVDKFVISLLYSDKISTGMTKEVANLSLVSPN
jgi:hypothetical protein